VGICGEEQHITALKKGRKRMTTLTESPLTKRCGIDMKQLVQATVDGQGRFSFAMPLMASKQLKRTEQPRRGRQ
jgi:hypothetical protein